MSSEFPTRPSDIAPDTSLVTLAERYYHHLWPVAGVRVQAEHLTRDEFTAHALAALSYQAALADRAEAGRWVTVVEALSAGLSVEQVAAATGAHPDDLPVFLASWAAGQRRHGLITDERYEQVLGLLAGQVQS